MAFLLWGQGIPSPWAGGFCFSNGDLGPTGPECTGKKNPSSSPSKNLFLTLPGSLRTFSGGERVSQHLLIPGDRGRELCRGSHGLAVFSLTPSEASQHLASPLHTPDCSAWEVPTPTAPLLHTWPRSAQMRACAGHQGQQTPPPRGGGLQLMAVLAWVLCVCGGVGDGSVCVLVPLVLIPTPDRALTAVMCHVWSVPGAAPSTPCRACPRGRLVWAQQSLPQSRSPGSGTAPCAPSLGVSLPCGRIVDTAPVCPYPRLLGVCSGRIFRAVYSM